MVVRNGDIAPPTCTPPQVLQNGVCVTLVPKPLPNVGPGIFKEWAAISSVAGSTASGLQVDPTHQNLPVYKNVAPVLLPKDTWRDFVITVTDWLKDHAADKKDGTLAGLGIAGWAQSVSRTFSIVGSLTSLKTSINDGIANLSTMLGAAQLAEAVMGESLFSGTSIANPQGASNILSAVSTVKDCTLAKIKSPATCLLSIDAFVLQYASQEWQKFGEDPIDMDYKTFVQPIGFGPVVGGLFGTNGDPSEIINAKRLSAITGILSMLDAANRTMDKYAGAVQEDDESFAIAQMGQLLGFIAQYNQYASELESVWRASNEQFHLAGIDGLSSGAENFKQLLSSISADGVPQELRNTYLLLGLTDADITEFQLAAGVFDVDSFLVGFDGRAPYRNSMPRLFGFDSPKEVPEPSTVLLFATSCIALVWMRRRQGQTYGS